ncbi:uncharacterized protein IL334_003027 [Kwoniella shivajii]|uniref:Zn(2)-C6 fungal-type domain-containing protein n=1 Tax=Kwoniella shivajii TaxID=564305 RepID=A0ABZ1CXN2_9TREE|nr:hypothetical protein IL334_003027 [Kwoniella shivajii]
MASVVNQRKFKSKQDRPCDNCRRLKQQCVVIQRGSPCRLCQQRNRICTFDQPVPKRRNQRSTLHPTISISQSNNTGIEGWDTLKATPSILAHDAAIGEASVFDVLREDRSAHVEVVQDLSVEDLDDDEFDALDAADWEESHFLGLGALSDFGLGDFKAGVDMVKIKHMVFRQVSQDPNHPVVFSRNPSRIFGNTGDGRELFDRMKSLLGEWNYTQLLEIFIERSLPAMPFMNAVRLRGACENWRGAGSFPYALLAGIIAATVVYVPQLWDKGTELWKIAVQALDDEYRRPINLRTVQLSLVHLSMRPNWNQSASAIELARAIGAAKLLGLHLDSSKWRLPRWERTVRKRVWWSLILQDKWRAALFDRPSNLAGFLHQVPPPSLLDDDWGGSDPSSGPSMLAFILMCKSTSILDDLQDSGSNNVVFLEALSRRTASLRDELKTALIEPAPGEGLSPGAQSTHLSLLGLDVMIMKKLFDKLKNLSITISPRVYISLLAVCERLVKMLEGLTDYDFDEFWQPFCYIHITNTNALLLQIAELHRHQRRSHDSPFDRSIDLIRRALKAVVRDTDTYGWDESRAVRCRTTTMITSKTDPIYLDLLSSSLLPPKPVTQPELDLSQIWDLDSLKDLEGTVFESFLGWQ